MINHIEHVLDCFRSIAAIPRPSKHEARIANWITAWATDHELDIDRDEANNIVIRVPGRGVAAAGPPVVLQGHLDMVCESTPDKQHDCENDPISVQAEDGWLTADRTTLGADNGIAIAIAMVIATGAKLSHPPLELLFTADEETGLNGAKRLSPGVLSGRRMINMDSEEEGTFTVGCAGGKDTTITLPVHRTATPEGGAFYEIQVSGLSGGHSGIDIQRPIGNANEILGRALRTLARQTQMRLVDIRGGSAHNAIPRDARAIFWAAEPTVSAVETRLTLLTQQIRSELLDSELRMTVTRAGEPSSEPVTADDSVTAVDLLIALPHGVDRMSAQIGGLVESSSNLATVRTSSESITVLTSQRSSVSSRLEAISTRIGAVAALAGARAEHTEGYPAWEPRLDSPLLDQAKRTYAELFGREPHVDVIHAGLECGVIGSIYPDMDMISLGPTIAGAHSPDERLDLESLQRVWDFLVRLLETLGE